MSDDREEYSVYQFFPDEGCERVASFIGLEAAVRLAKRLTETVGGRSGIIREIRITDGGDFTVFQWKYGEGVTYPTLDMLDAQRH